MGLRGLSQMTFMHMSNALMDEINSWTYRPSKVFSLGLPAVFMLFFPKEWVDFVLQSPNPPDILNPWIGLVFLYMASFFVCWLISFIIMTPYYWIKKKFEKKPNYQM